MCCVKILVNPKGLTAFYALPTQKSVCFKLPAPKTVSAWMNFCFCVHSRANARQGQKCEKSPRRPILGISGSTSDCLKWAFAADLPPFPPFRLKRRSFLNPAARQLQFFMPFAVLLCALRRRFFRKRLSNNSA